MDKVPAFGATRRALLAPTKPDYSTWSLKDTWSVSEGAKLICGRNPYDKIPGPQLLNRDRRVIDIIDTAFAAAQNSEMTVVRSALLPIHLLVEPASFLRWAKSQNLAIPDELGPLAAQAENSLKLGAETLIKERVITIARTLWVIDPDLTDAEVAIHRAMRQLVSDDDALTTDKLRWVAEAREG
jgi:hypothetical protein